MGYTTWAYSMTKGLKLFRFVILESLHKLLMLMNLVIASFQFVALK